MDESSLSKFDPTVAELTALVESTKEITATDLADPRQLAIVKENRIVLKNARVRIEKTGKSLREDALAFQRAVISKEKELVAIIEPEEERLAAIEEEAKRLSIRAARMIDLPVQKARIEGSDLAGYQTKTDDEILEMTGTQFDAYFNEMCAQKLEADTAKARQEQEAKDQELRAREAELEREKREAEHAKEIERAKAETEERVRREADEKAARELADAERAEKQKEAERKSLEKKEAYVTFLKEHGYTKETASEYHTIETIDGYALYKKVGFFSKDV